MGLLHVIGPVISVVFSGAVAGRGGSLPRETKPKAAPPEIAGVDEGEPRRSASKTLRGHHVDWGTHIFAIHVMAPNIASHMIRRALVPRITSRRIISNDCRSGEKGGARGADQLKRESRSMSGVGGSSIVAGYSLAAGPSALAAPSPVWLAPLCSGRGGREKGFSPSLST